jgi:hypothetical protein
MNCYYNRVLISSFCTCTGAYFMIHFEPCNYWLIYHVVECFGDVGALRTLQFLLDLYAGVHVEMKMFVLFCLTC